MQKLIRNRTGSALIASVVFAAVFSIVGAGAIRLITQGSDMHKRDKDVIKTYWADEAGIRLALRYISQINNPGAINENFTAMSGYPVNNFTPNVTISSTATGPNMFSYTVTSNSTLPNSTITTQNNLVGVSLSTMQKWAYFEKNTEATKWVRKVINGNYHTNGYIMVGENMQAFAHVVNGTASTAGRINPGFEFDRPNFPDIYKKGIRRAEYGYTDEPSVDWLETRFPDYEHIGAIDTEPMEPNSFTGVTDITNAGNRDIAIVLQGNKYDVWKYNGSTWNKTDNNISVGSTPIIKTYGDTYVRGTLDGRLTIVSENGYDIVMGGNILYNDTNLTTSTDVLALVSGQNIVIPNSASFGGYSHSFTDNGAIIYGSLFAVNGILNVKNIGGYSTMRQFEINGGILINQLEGTFNSNGTSNPDDDYGIETMYNQDPRFQNNTANAPGIPFAREEDQELSSGGTVIYKNILNPGVWTNTLASGS